jgi:hypothetical protein
VLIGYIECHAFLIFIEEVRLYIIATFINIDFVNIYYSIVYIYKIVIDLYEVLTKQASLHIKFIVALFSGRDTSWLLLPVIFLGL